MVTTNFRNGNSMANAMAVHALKRGHLFFPWGQRRGRGPGVHGWNFLSFVFLACSQCVPAWSQLCFSMSQCVPKSSTHLSHILCPQSSPFSPSRPYMGAQREGTLFSHRNLYFGEPPKGQVFFIRMLIKKSNNFNYRLHGTLVGSTRLSNTYH